MASEVVAVAALISLNADKKARWDGHCIVCAGLLRKPPAGCRTGEVELVENNSSVSQNEVIGRREMLRKQQMSGSAYHGEIYAGKALAALLG
jgi:hypothetical protein